MIEPFGMTRLSTSHETPAEFAAPGKWDVADGDWDDLGRSIYLKPVVPTMRETDRPGILM